MRKHIKKHIHQYAIGYGLLALGLFLTGLIVGQETTPGNTLLAVAVSLLAPIFIVARREALRN